MRRLLVSAGFLGACATTPPPKSTAAPEPDVIAQICRHEHVDATSQVYIGRDGHGRVIRYSATPSRSIADMGVLYFDVAGVFLGEGMGAESPWGDEQAMKKLRRRDEKLQAGATFAEGDLVPCGAP